MNLNEYIIKYNSQFGQDETKMIDLSDIDTTENERVGEMLTQYVLMVKEKLERKQVARNDETFQLSEMSEDERYIFDSVAGTYIYENQYDRKQLQEDIAEITGLTRAQVKAIAHYIVGEIKEASTDEKNKVAKMLAAEEDEPNA